MADRRAQIEARLSCATEGPWAAWTDQDGQPHMDGLLMVGNAAGVIPDGESWVEPDEGVNPIAHCYTPEDRALIAHASDDLRWLLDALAATEAERDALAAKLAAVEALAEQSDYHWIVVDTPDGEYVQEGSPCVSVDDLRDALEAGEEPPACGHVQLARGCGGCDPSAIEFIKDDGGPWVRVAEAGEDA